MMRTFALCSALALVSASVHTNATAQEGGLAGYWWWTWSSSQRAPPGTNMCVAFSGWADVSQALSDSAPLVSKLSGDKYLSIGGGNANGHFTADRLNSLNAAMQLGKLSDYNGVVYDIEEGDSGLADAFAASFKAARAAKLKVLVTTSHSQPYGIPDGHALMAALIADSNIDYLSPQLYTSGNEASNDFTANGTPWSAYASAKASIVPAVCIGARDYPSAQTFFAKQGITLGGFVQWVQA